MLSSTFYTESTLIRFSNIHAIAEFLGTKEESEDLRRFKSWYPQDTLCHLAHSLDKKQNFLKAVFTQNNFLKEIDAFKTLANALNQPGIFIGTVGIDQHHFIAGVLFNNKLLLINPVGRTSHQDFYLILQQLKAQQKKINVDLDIYLSTTTLQRDAEGLYSCGPICVELLKHFSELNLPAFFEQLTAAIPLAQDHIAKQVDLSPYLSISLNNLTLLSGTAYQNQIEEMRQQHLSQLLEVCSDKKEKLKLDDYFQEDCVNATEQVLLRRMVLTGNNTLISVLQDPLFLKLLRKIESGPSTTPPVPPTSSRSSPSMVPPPAAAAASPGTATKSPWVRHSIYLLALTAIVLTGFASAYALCHYMLWPSLNYVLSSWLSSTTLANLALIQQYTTWGLGLAAGISLTVKLQNKIGNYVFSTRQEENRSTQQPPAAPAPEHVSPTMHAPRAKPQPTRSPLPTEQKDLSPPAPTVKPSH